MPVIEETGWEPAWYDNAGAEITLGLLEVGGTTAFTSGFEIVSGGSEGKLALSVAAGALFGTELGNGSEASIIGGTGGRFEGKFEAGKELEVKVRELVEVGSREGYSGKFEDPVGKGALKPEYCICCCIEGGIDGGRSKDCWCRGSPFGGP